MIPTIKFASVKVMRSYDYCHFEINLSSEYEVGEIFTSQVDELRKEAARLADKAVEQYKLAKRASDRQLASDGKEIIRLKQLAGIIEGTPEYERTPEEKSILKALADSAYESRRYDYQDDWNYDSTGRVA